jgi:translation elongation factor EF-G
MAFKNAMREAAPLRLEPIMAVEVNTPIEYQGERVLVEKIQPYDHDESDEHQSEHYQPVRQV